ncbi:MAG: amidohydrolase family protein [Bacteroidota bacterium]|nr:amidohydrolase family protein [Bacteroidota bacterium]
MTRTIYIFLFLFATIFSRAQVTFQNNGAADPNHTTYAFINCTLHVDFETVINNATLVVKDGLVVEAGEKVVVPAGAIAKDLKGKHIYPAFIELYSDYGMPEIKANVSRRGAPQMETNTKGAYGWNQAVKPEVDAFKLYTNNDKQADELRKLGFGLALTSQKDGIVRGSGALVALTNNRENENIIMDKAAAFYSFKKGTSTQDYPSSLMGSIALLRQTYLDAEWYKTQPATKAEYNISLEAFNNLQGLPQIFEVSNKLNALRADKIGDEFKVKYIIKGRGDEYQRVDEIFNTFNKYIIPLNFPDALDVEDPYDAELVTTADLKHWEMAPANPKILLENGIQFALSSCDLKEKKIFLKNLRKAVLYGMTEKNALKALTATPAQILGIADKAGSLKKGMMANFFIASTNLFEDNAVIYETWVKGNGYIYGDYNQLDVRAKYDLSFGDKKVKAEIKGEIDAPEMIIYTKDTIKTKASFVFKSNIASFSFNTDSVSLFRLSGNYNEITKSFNGSGQKPDGTWFDFTLAKTTDLDPPKKKEENKKDTPEIGEVFYPFTAFGKPEKRENIIKKYKNRLGAILIKDATIWTNDTVGILKEHDVYIVDGKIVRIAPNIDAPKGAFAKLIDGKGKHLTAGIIDEHSHIAISEGVNEGTEASSAEVRIGDIINSEDINIYRQLAGGVTSAQLLHGSANPIGGQASLIKLRWGLAPEDLKYEKADGFIKFALGENVKQTNWGENNNVRFPQTRMGVEQVYYDYFIRAKEYEKNMKLVESSKDKNKITPRRDLELDALVEIINKKRFITCHSYVQSEINMLMNVADSMGFKVNTFTHILEGYKLADKMKEHGVAASTFADWWAYKYEVNDAIPYNAALLTKMNVTTSINSDDAEMGRRLNQEAAKAVKYGGLSEEEAWKLCTLNPAKMLHIDDKVGTVKTGKVADLVLWSDNPLSIYAKAEKTIVDGIIYFDNEEDVILRENLKKERVRIISKMLEEKKKGGTLAKPTSKKPHLYHCETIEGEE